VLFYSPNCGHCHQVITEDLPPLLEKYGDRLQIIGVNIADVDGNMLFGAAGDKCDIPSENLGVPLLVVSDVCLIGSADIPNKFPALIQQYLFEGGVDWPNIPGLAEILAQAEVPQPTATPEMAASPSPPLATATSSPTTRATAASLHRDGSQPSAVPSPTETDAGAPAARVPAVAVTATQPPPTSTPTPGIVMVSGDSEEGFGARFNRDLIGNALSVIILAGMIAALAWVLARRPWRAWSQGASVSRSPHDRSAGNPNRSGPLAPNWAVPLLSLIGLGVAGYLAYVETQQVQAVCGPVGDCNSVQQSEYARLFGLIPIGVVGVIGYLAILAAWAISRLNAGRLGQWAAFAVWAMTAVGVLFSIYLTFLEPFVIGATCAWCLSSAVIMTLLLLNAQNSMRFGEAQGEGRPG